MRLIWILWVNIFRLAEPSEIAALRKIKQWNSLCIASKKGQQTG
jgi:hypothetical protein